METTKNILKQEYIVPQIGRIVLDNQISLQLESTPPQLSNEAHLTTPDYLNNDPFKSNRA